MSCFWLAVAAPAAAAAARGWLPNVGSVPVLAAPLVSDLLRLASVAASLGCGGVSSVLMRCCNAAVSAAAAAAAALRLVASAAAFSFWAAAAAAARSPAPRARQIPPRVVECQSTQHLADIARHVVGHHLTQQKRVHNCGKQLAGRFWPGSSDVFCTHNVTQHISSPRLY